MEIMDRSVAKELGASTFYTGKLCANGHLSYRYTQSGTCSECINGDRSVVSYSKDERKLQKLKDEVSRHEFKIFTLNEIISNLEKKIAVDKQRFMTVLEQRKLILKEESIREAQAQLAKINAKIAERNAIKAQKINAKIAIDERKSALATFIKFNEPIHLTNVTKAKALLTAYAIMRNPDITISDLWLTALPKHSVVYTMLAHPDDIEEIRSQLRQWYSNDANIDKIRDDIINNKILKL